MALMGLLVSLSWRTQHDVPIVLYGTVQWMKYGAIPYRDFITLNLPGTFVLFRLVATLFGTTDFAVHLANMCVIGLASMLIFFVLSDGGRFRLPALFGVSLGILSLLSRIYYFVLQRELFALVFLAGIIAVTFQPSLTRWMKGAVIGFMLGCLATIKPQLVLYGIPCVIVLLAECSWREKFRFLMAVGIAGGLVLAVCLAWIIHMGAWTSFCELFTYWSMYAKMTRHLVFVSWYALFVEKAMNAMHMLFSPFMGVACVSVVGGYYSGALSRARGLFWISMLLISVIIPAFTAQCWNHHQIPFLFLSMCLTGYLLTVEHALIRMLCVALAFVWFAVAGWRVCSEAFCTSVVKEKHGVQDDVAVYLKAHLHRGECVQVDDWYGGLLYAMMVTDARPATRFIETFCFRSNIDHPLTKRWEQEYLSQLQKNPPRYILENKAIRWPTGDQTRKRFETFDAWKMAHYAIVEGTPYYSIWKRQDKKGINTK